MQPNRPSCAKFVALSFALMGGGTLATGASPSSAPAALIATYTVSHLSLEAAQIAANAALQNCRAAGYQIAVTVVDRSGNTIVTLRDRFAGAHTIETATNKAWTAASFKDSTTALGV